MFYNFYKPHAPTLVKHCRNILKRFKGNLVVSLFSNIAYGYPVNAAEGSQRTTYFIRSDYVM